MKIQLGLQASEASPVARVSHPANLCAFLYSSTERSRGLCVVHARQQGELIVVGRTSLMWRAATLLKLARSIRDPSVAGALVEKAADLQSELDQTNPPDCSPRAPDVELPLPRPS